jgi:hypothetical protein
MRMSIDLVGENITKSRVKKEKEKKNCIDIQYQAKT